MEQYLSSQVGHLYFESASLQTPQRIAMAGGALYCWLCVADGERHLIDIDLFGSFDINLRREVQMQSM